MQIDQTHALRWRFDYRGKPSRFGGWCADADPDHPELCAWAQPKQGLVRAAIEVREVLTQEVRVVAECDGHDFVNFAWFKTGVLGGADRCGNLFVGETIWGLELWTHEEMTRVMVDGSVGIARRPQGHRNVSLVV